MLFNERCFFRRIFTGPGTAKESAQADLLGPAAAVELARLIPEVFELEITFATIRPEMTSF